MKQKTGPAQLRSAQNSQVKTQDLSLVWLNFVLGQLLYQFLLSYVEFRKCSAQGSCYPAVCVEDGWPGGWLVEF